MFGDIVKIGVKTALVVTITAAILVIFSTVQIPNLDFTLMSQGMGTALAIIYHWAPASQVLFPLAVSMLGIQLAIILFEYAMIAVRWVMKVNE